VRVRIDKRIPLQAGLGGGSSDGAAALRAFAAFWRVSIAGTRMRRLASALGADVPFFLEGGTALGVNRGDLIRRLPDRPSAWVALVLPDFSVSTKEAFGWWDARAAAGAVFAPPGNDLQAVVAERHPEILEIVEALARAGAGYASMSGSGSAVFGLFETKRAAAAAAARLSARSRRTLVARTLTRTQFQSGSRISVKVKSKK
jgi:4-diphosphocytidyl-2-C-methyl-D-erythritol kinase